MVSANTLFNCSNLKSSVFTSLFDRSHEAIPGGACDCRGYMDGSVNTHVDSDKTLVLNGTFTVL